MKTMILITTPFGLENNIPEIKKRIVEYVGSRLIKDNPDGVPFIELNSYLDKMDFPCIWLYIPNHRQPLFPFQLLHFQSYQQSP